MLCKRSQQRHYYPSVILIKTYKKFNFACTLELSLISWWNKCSSVERDCLLKKMQGSKFNVLVWDAHTWAEAPLPPSTLYYLWASNYNYVIWKGNELTFRWMPQQQPVNDKQEGLGPWHFHHHRSLWRTAGPEDGLRHALVVGRVLIYYFMADGCDHQGNINSKPLDSLNPRFLFFYCG